MDDTTDETSNVFKLMEKRLFYFPCIHPMIVWITGIYMAYVLGLYGWLVLKFFFVIVLTLYHINLGRYLKDFKMITIGVKPGFFK